MSDPEETPAQAMERLAKEISQLRRLRAQMPMLILEPYVEEATKHIGEVAAKMTIKATVPASEAIAGSRQEAQITTQPPTPSAPPEGVPAVGTKLYSVGFHSPALVIAHIPTGKTGSPEEFEVLILTADGGIHTVPLEDLAPLTAVPGAPAAAPKLSSGARVKIKPTGKTGYVSEVADATAIIALDEGGFLTVPIADLEPL